MILATVGHEFADHGVLVNIVPTDREIVWIANSVIGESALPHPGAPPAKIAERMRVAALDQLDGPLDRYIMSRCKQDMDMIGHEDEGVQCIAAFSAVVIKGLEE